MKLKEDELALCIVKKIEGTTVFLETEDGIKGSMVLSEVAAGRIRNIREYVFPNKKIDCKILKIKNGHIEFSLRRVTAKEKTSVLEKYKKERALANMLKILGENSDVLIKKIKEKYDIEEFLSEVSKNQKIIEQFINKEKSAKLIKMIAEKTEKNKISTKKIILKTLAEDGITRIKEILNINNSDIRYLGSSVFSVSVSSTDFKKANALLIEVLNEIEKRAKSKKAHFEVLK